MNSNTPQSPFVLQSGSSRNVVIETPHLGRLVPGELSHHKGLVRAAERRWDNHIDRAGQALLERVGGEWIGSVYSRMVVDLNRGADRVDSRVCPQWPGAREHSDGGVVIPFARERGRYSPLYSNPLESEEIEARLKNYWFPYHDKLQARLDALQTRYGHALLIGLHSAEPEAEHRCGDRPVVYLGTNNGTTCDGNVLGILRNALEERNMIVIAEGFYQGAFTIQAYGKERSVHAVQVELDRRFMKEDRELLLQLQPLITALKAVSTKGLSSASPPKRSRRIYGTRTYVDPLSGDIFPY